MNGWRKVGGELNHLVMLCHQGKIDTVDLTSFSEETESIYKSFLIKICNSKEG